MLTHILIILGIIVFVYSIHKSFNMSHLKLIASKEFKTELQLEYSMTPVPTKLGMADNKMDLYVSENGDIINISWWYKLADGEEDEIGMGIEVDEDDNKRVTGYDAVFELPKEAIALLKMAGYNTDEIE